MTSRPASAMSAALDAELKQQEDEETQNYFECVGDRIDTDKGTRLALIDAESGDRFKSIRAKFQRLDELP
ncbi:hypothetical protein L914_21682 [Phytophthora nicotianae]|uniref:Uncharacterized protein n=1 Tax=Phytophthora nicotianae TaxID=4792 RepID=W2M2N1_PHYNI|nr:hypothetical protein L914_21682 [Phytophthora nicotianae]